MTRTELFLEKYKALERAATGAYGWESDGRAVYRLTQLPQFRKIKDQLSFCREVRNLLQHNCRIQDAYAVEPSEQMLALLDRVTQQVLHPTLCRDVCTPVARLLYANGNDLVWPAMREMYHRGLTHLPILEDGRVVGVFSENAVFCSLVSGERRELSPDVRFRELRAHLNGSSRRSEEYRFFPAAEPVAQAEAAFERAFSRGKRIAMFFLTEHGRKEERLLGVLTAWDILGN